MKGRLALMGMLLLCALALSPAWAHQTKVVGGKYKVIVGMVKEPPFTEERNGLDLIVRRSDDNTPVENLEKSLAAIVISPDGKTARPLKVRAQFGKPGYYTDDFMLLKPGIYKFRIFGTITDVNFDETFESHEVQWYRGTSFSNAMRCQQRVM